MLKSFSVIAIFICVANSVFASEKCGKNEKPTSCFEAVCERRTCSDLGKPIRCVRIDPKFCTKGCLCEDTYLRAENGTCIPADQCSCNNQCGENEVYDICPPEFPGDECNADTGLNTCLSNPEPGDPECNPGCRCIDNYKRNEYGCCVPKEQCLQCNGQNEVSGCKSCPPQTCESIGKNYFCPLQPSVCQPECRCKNDYYRNKIGDCISKENCLKCTGPNEFFSCGGACDNVCATLSEQNQTHCPIVNIKCNEMCYCEEGYARDSNNICVPISQCPQLQCYGQNEEVGCQRTCPLDTCDSIGKIYECPLQPLVCKPECRCKNGYYRNKLGVCISKEDCLKCTGPNEYYSCGGACDNVCATLSEQNQTHCPIVNIKCNEMCYCEEGYARDSNNICVPISQCSQLQCYGENEEIGCQRTCPPNTCESIGKIYECPLQPLVCKSECRCKNGYYRNKLGVCISKKDCLKCTGPNEYYSCGGACDNVCATLSKQNQTNCPIVNIKCNEMCYCEKGYARDSNKVCVPISQCPQIQCYGKNEVSGCKRTCPPETCDSIGKHYLCPRQPEECIPECRCQKGYYRNKLGECISKEDCHTCGINEVYDFCPVTCPPRTCDALTRAYKCKPPLQYGDPNCKPGCRCADNYYRNSKGVCVRKEQCPKPPGVICGADEVYSSCVNGGCGRWNCSQPGIICIDLIEGACREGCHCKEGLLRADNGSCIPANQCPLQCYGENEEIGCQRTCPPNTCESIGKIYECPLQPLVCKSECRCKNGYYRNKLGVCISKKDCLKCTGPNEYYSCGGACDNVCATLSKQNQTNCPIVNIKCNEMCYCEKGYARDSNKVCVPISQCPQIQCYGKNEVSGCKRTCPPETCDSIGKQYFCSRQPVECIPECRCQKGYYRNKLGECISKEDCHTCGINEVYDFCPVTCPPRTCDALTRAYKCKPPLQYGDPNCKPGCRCADNYYRNSKGVCVRKEQCPKPPGVICGADEVYSSCVNGGCGRWNCSQPGIICIDLIEGACREGCHCKEGLLRADNGSCIPANQCPLQCYGQNEVSGCKRLCPPETCDSIGKNFFCPRQPVECVPECRCQKGYYRNNLGVCISKEDCLKCNGPNEYYSCGGACDNVCATLNKQNQTNCPIINIKCNEMCYCKEGYARDSNNICVPIAECKETACGTNEIYDRCPANCPPETCDSIEQAKLILCAVPPKYGDPNCKPRCRCVDNHYRNKNGICVPKDQCPKKPGVICGLDEVYSSCANGGCGRWKCSQPGIICIDLIEGGCREGCLCKDGLLRANNGTCIPANQCPLNCYGANEVSGCKKTCPPDTCDSIGKIYHCPLQTANCEPECRCKKGYFRNKLGECISKENCLKCTGPNEYFACDGACDNVCATLNEQNKTYCPIVNKKCNEMCYCEDGYARDFNNLCVPISKCPKQKCGANEIYDLCPATCPPRTCDGIKLAEVIRCKAPPKYGDPDCSPGCTCIDNYYRNKDGVCVPKNQCLKCGANEIYDLCPATCPPRTCDGIKLAEVIDCKAPPKYGDPDCRPGCTCIDNYYRNKDGVCVPKNQCQKCGANEIYDLCPATCPPKTCDGIKLAEVIRCKAPPKYGDPDCSPGCTCIDNYYRNKDGVCVPKNQCPKPPGVICGADEVYSSCVNGGCGRWNCSQPGKICIKLAEGACREGCHCREGLLRADNGSCIPAEQCPLNCRGINEVSGCHAVCPPQTCESIGKVYPCPLQLGGCKQECRCKENYYRNKLGVCISKEDCLKCTGPHEYFSCGGACDNVCTTLSEQNQTHCPIVNIQCNRRCYCEKGYARNCNNTCVPISQCPNLKCDGDNEVTGCLTTCPPQTCESIGKSYSCPAQPVGTVPECRCKKGYYRNKAGDCISKADCMKCTGPNEYFSTDGTCDQFCETLNEPDETECSPDEECSNMCRCVDGYARDSNNNCVPTSQCGQSNDNGLEEFEKGNIDFTASFLKIAAYNNPGVSIIFSAVSVLLLLAQITLYASGQALQELLHVLNLDAKNQIRSFVPQYLDILKSQRNVTLDLAERMYININYQLLESVLSDTKKIFDAEAQNVDFCEQSKAAKIINDWVLSKTNNLIPNLVSPNAIDCNTVLVLVNAIYFKGDWQNKFDPKKTIQQQFYVNENKNITVNMMRQTKSFKYTETKTVQSILLPYKSDKLSLMVVLPKNKDGLYDSIDEIEDGSLSLSNIMKAMNYAQVDLSIPKIHTTTTTDLKDVLTKANVKTIFSRNASGLDITKNGQPVYVSSALQKAYIEVNEVGSEAAAATAVVLGARSVASRQTTEFIANHPFIYYILYNEIPIFCGIYYGNTK